MISALRSVWIWIASAAIITSRLPLMAILRLFDRDPLHRAVARLFRRAGPMLARVLPWRVHIKGQDYIDPGRTYVVVSNHQSFADIPVVAHLKLDAKWMAKAELFRVPLIGRMLRLAGDIPVERTDRRKAANALLQAARYLREGCSVVFFPEGTRSLDGRILPFNDGPFQLAIREQVPIVPLVLDGSGSALPRDSWIFGPAQDIRLIVLKPVEPGPKNGNSAEFREVVRQQMIDALEALRRSRCAQSI
jgi:1-acyl-sn-glycerol-3-phosphate acyltransferase